MDYFWNLKKFSLINNKESKFNRNFATAVRTLTKSVTERCNNNYSERYSSR